VKNGVAELFKKLDKLDPREFGSWPDPGDEIPFLRFQPGAQKFFDQWREGLEKQLRSSEDNAAVEAHLSKYRSLMPTLALLFHLLDIADGRVQRHWQSSVQDVSLEAAQLAVKWCDFLSDHARRIYGMVTNSAVDLSKTIGKQHRSRRPRGS